MFRVRLTSWTNGAQDVEVSNGSESGLVNVRWASGQETEVSTAWFADRVERDQEDEEHKW